MNVRTQSVAWSLALLLFASAQAAPVALEEIRHLYEAKLYEQAFQAALDLSREQPEDPGLKELRTEIKRAMLDQEDLDLAAPVPLGNQQMIQETRRQELIPDSYGRKRTVAAPVLPHTRAPSLVTSALNQPVSMHLEAADLSTLLSALAEDSQVNLISDQALGAGKKVDVHVDDVHLKEFLEYLTRNFDIAFYYGESAIWVTTKAAAPKQPMETRVYRLRKGMQFHGSDWGSHTEGAKPTTNQNNQISTISYNATVPSTGKTYIEDILERFIPLHEDAQLFFDRNTHALFVRNTPENIRLTEQMLDNLDISPPQVFIEARFIEVRASDLREVGIDWVLDSPLTVSRKAIADAGVERRLPRTVVEAGSSISASPFTGQAEGPFPLGPQGSFGIVSEGNPPTSTQGLNLTYKGILTEPMFGAVLHALDISGKSKTLSVPRVATMNNTPAKLRDGEDLLYFDEFEAQAFTLLDTDNKRVTLTALIPKGKPLKEELGITLVAVPSVGADLESITLLLTPTISRLVRFVSYQDDSERVTDAANIDQVVVKLPVIARREVQTKVQVKSGETVVMGGLIDTVTQDTKHKIPILGSIPGLGRLFRRDDVTEERRNLLVFVTATVISDRGESLVTLPAQRSPDPEAPVPLTP
jgi:type II secretory pathway component GspD/PulD (secretin)